MHAVEIAGFSAARSLALCSIIHPTLRQLRGEEGGGDGDAGGAMATSQPQSFWGVIQPRGALQICCHPHHHPLGMRETCIYFFFFSSPKKPLQQ